MGSESKKHGIYSDNEKAGPYKISWMNANAWTYDHDPGWVVSTRRNCKFKT